MSTSGIVGAATGKSSKLRSRAALHGRIGTPRHLPSKQCRRVIFSITRRGTTCRAPTVADPAQLGAEGISDAARTYLTLHYGGDMIKQVGRRQAVRHGPLEPAFVGSNPTAPAANMRAVQKEEGCRRIARP